MQDHTCMSSQDDEDFEPQEFGVKQSDKWEGEDEDDKDVKDNWDDDEEEDTEQKADSTQTESTPAANVKKRKTIKQKILEKEEQAREKALKREQDKKLQDEEEEKPLTEEELMAEKLRRQKLVEESDLELTKQAFGVMDDIPVDTKSIDAMSPSTREEFVQLSDLIVGKLTKYESCTEYIPFLEMLFRDLCAGLEAEDVKRLGSAINILSSEKLKAQKAKKGKKSAKKATLAGTSAKAGRKDDLDAFGGGNYDYGDEFDDFM